MFKKILFFCLITLSFSDLKAQDITLSPEAEISVLTIGPGELLYDSFGHSGFRVKDQTQGIDIVLNYGSYDFDTPNFLLKFARGKLPYKVRLDSFEDFLYNYKYQDRWIKEQVLNLTQSEKQAFLKFFNNNLKPENKYYLYDFFYDNCATKMRDISENIVGEKLIFITDSSAQNDSFRELIQQNLNWNSWGSIGIDLALGSVIDKEAGSLNYMFLPENILHFFSDAYLFNEENKFVKKTTTLYNAKRKGKQLDFSFFSPIVIISLISLIIIFITYRDNKKNKRSKWLDVILFVVTGIIGVFILLLWFATDHTATAYNYNLLWAFPLNIFVLFQVLKTKPKKWFKKYLVFLIVLICLLFLHWLTGVQIFALGLLPLFIALLIRCIYLVGYYKENT